MKVVNVSWQCHCLSKLTTFISLKELALIGLSDKVVNSHQPPRLSYRQARHQQRWPLLRGEQDDS
jgi:hypothetical protein